MISRKVIKIALSRAGLLPAYDFIRHSPDFMRWLRSGFSGSAPPPIKRLIIRHYLKAHRLAHFVETGTHIGDTLATVAQDPRYQCISIELAGQYYREALKRFSNYPNVRLLHGDSAELMPAVVSELKEPALFWLDGHYSAGDTAKGKKNTPISQELQAIFSSSIHGHVVLIDDIRYFNGTDDYPHLDEILSEIRKNGRHQVEISSDIARLRPQDGMK